MTTMAQHLATAADRNGLTALLLVAVDDELRVRMLTNTNIRKLAGNKELREALKKGIAESIDEALDKPLDDLKLIRSEEND